jgi:hypothetical protein
MKTEPALVVGAITAFLTAVIAACVAFGVEMSQDQQNAILGMIAPTVGVILLASGIIRQFVRPASTSVSKGTAKEVAIESADIGKADPLGKL